MMVIFLQPGVDMVNGLYNLVATFIRSGYQTAQEVRINLLFFCECPKTSLILKMIWIGSVNHL